jgi:hypothetical protein
MDLVTFVKAIEEVFSKDNQTEIIYIYHGENKETSFSLITDTWVYLDTSIFVTIVDEEDKKTYTLIPYSEITEVTA